MVLTSCAARQRGASPPTHLLSTACSRWTADQERSTSDSSVVTGLAGALPKVAPEDVLTGRARG